ncbi:MAG: glucose 1-dehydrogenase [Halieaceae bacterium]|mgnify:CR=1 FL=1|jgi:3(or 17)beta-hydroxysteroid dehydrogenase|nr:glucose 1-dehydrogenase [Halieaceae bacterium]
MALRLEGKVALVTGSGSGLGEATAKRFAQMGAHVYVTDVNIAGLERVVDEIKQAGGGATGREQNVTIEADWDVLMTEIIQSHGQLDILVNNAGIALTGNVEEVTLDDWRKTQAVNLDAVFMGTRAAVKVMKGRGGSIINISSIEGIIGDPNTPAYNASKGGVRIFTKSAALHCAAQGYNIRVNSVHPGFIWTPMVEEGFAQLNEVGAEMLAKVNTEIPLGSMGEPLDIANGCLFLASDESRYMTGSELVIDGGYTCR